MTDTTTENFARTQVIATIRCLIDVHGSRASLGLDKDCELVNNYSHFTNEVVENNIVEDLYANRVYKQDNEAYVECYNLNTKKWVNLRLVDLNLSNLEYILKQML